MLTRLINYRMVLRTYTDDEIYLDVQPSPNLGTITLQLFLVHAYRQFFRQPRSHGPRRAAVQLSADAIHERSKKLCDHRVALGSSAPARRPFFNGNGPRRSRIMHRPYDAYDSGPYVTFKFKYRPLGGLIDFCLMMR